MTIKTRVTLIYLIPGVLLTALAAISFYWFSALNFKTQVFDNLKTIAYSRAHEVNTYLDVSVDRVADFAGGSAIQQCMTPVDAGLTCDSAAISELLRNHMLQQFQELSEVYILDTEGFVVGATVSDRIEQNYALEKEFIVGSVRPHIGDILYEETSGRNTFHIAVPISHDGQTSGVMVAVFLPDRLYDIVSDTNLLGETGEAYLVGAGNVMVSPSRFNPDSALKQTVNSEGTRDCFKDMREYAGEGGIIEDHAEPIFRIYNYRNVRVLSTHNYVPRLQWCLMTEIEDQEATQPIRAMLGFISVVSLIVIVIVYLLSLWLGRRISRPIVKLKEGVDIIRKGNLEYMVGTKDADEIGELSRAFDEMAYSFRKFKEVVLKNEQQAAARKMEKNNPQGRTLADK